MVSQTNKRPPRQPLSPEEVQEIVKLKKLRQLVKTEKFKQTSQYKYLNLFNICCVIIYTEIIIAFLAVANFSLMEVNSVTPYYGDDRIGGKRVVTSLVVKASNGTDYDVSVNDTCTIPPVIKEMEVGKDWILQKEIKVKMCERENDFIIKRSFPLLVISLLLVIVTFVLFTYNLNQSSYSLNVISFINLISLSYFFAI